MKPIHKRIIASLLAVLASLTAVASTLPPDVTLDQIPLISWLIALSSGLTGFYAPNTVVKDEPDTAPTVHTTEEPKP